MTSRRIFWPAFWTLTGVIILCGLGVWQLMRLEWKAGILERLEMEYARDPLENPLDFRTLQTIAEDALPLVHGSVRGRFDYTKEIRLGPKTRNGQIGYHILTPLNLESGGTIFVNRGFVPEDSATPDFLKGTQPKGLLTVSGIVRKPDPGIFTPRNSPGHDVWLWADLPEMGESKEIQSLAPVLLYAESASKSFGGLDMRAIFWNPPNNHLSYAVFWFTMAAVLAGFFCFFILVQHRRK